MGSTLDYCQWTVMLVLLCTKMTISKDPGEYHPIYACDGKMLKIECKENHVINLIRANYGRYSITVCNDNGSTEWSVNCMSPKSFSILQGRCSLKQNCSVAASTSLFDDPCPGTVKYLEAQYACVPATVSSTSRANPPWLITSPPAVWMTAKSFAVHSETSTASLPTSSATPSTEEANTNLQEIEAMPAIPLPSDPETPLLHVPDELPTEISVPDDKEPMCRPTIIRNLTWNWKSAGEVYVQPCPGGATGLAQWRCLKMSTDLAAWFPDTPDLSECRSMWLNSLQSRIDQEDSLITIAEELSQVTESKTLWGGDLRMTVNIIRDLAHKMRNNIKTFQDYRQREAMVYELLQSIAQVSSNLLDVSQQPSWKDLSLKEQMQVASLLLIGLEENSFLLAEITSREKVVTHCLQNILLSVQVLETNNVHDERFPTFYLSDGCALKVDNWLQLRKSSLLDNADAGLVRLVYIAFDTLQQVLQVQPNGQQRQINSKVLSASLSKGRHIQLAQPVTLCLRHLQSQNVSNPTCVFWDYTQNQWSDEGCTVVSTNETHTICRCMHLTNFAIMVDVRPMVLASVDRSLSILTVVLVVVALLALLVSIALVLRCQCRQRRKEYGSAGFAGNCRWFCKCFSCCQGSESEKTFSGKEPRPSLYDNATMQSMASVVDNSGAIRATHVLPHASGTMPRSYTAEGPVEGQYPTSQLRLSHHYPTYNRNGSFRKHREARRLEHLENTLQHRNKKLTAASLRSSSPHSHTYSEIAATSQRGDPVYEEIEREREQCSQVSDVSDEEARRISDTSRQSSKSYGDHRPLIPHNPVTDRNFHAALDAAYRQQLMERNAKTVSVLDGQTVVCHLQQSDPRIYHKSVGHAPLH